MALVGADDGGEQFVLACRAGTRLTKPSHAICEATSPATRPTHAVADHVQTLADQERVLVGLPDQSAVSRESGR